MRILRSDSVLLAAAAASLTLAGAVYLASQAQPASAAPPIGSVFFNDATDTIQISGDTTLGDTATFEAVFYLPSGVAADGYVWNEWAAAGEDKKLTVGPTNVAGGAPNVGEASASPTISLDTPHHVAYVVDDGLQNRIYLDGQRLSDSNADSFIVNGAGAHALGKNVGRGDATPSFIGYLNSFRVSSVARYNLDFTPPLGNLANEAGTEILYNFSASEIHVGGTTTVDDLSGNGHTGTFGAPAGGTSPQIGPTATPTPSPTQPATATPTPTPTFTPSPSPVCLVTNVPPVTPECFRTASPSPSPICAVTNPPSVTPHCFRTATPTATPSPGPVCLVTNVPPVTPECFRTASPSPSPICALTNVPGVTPHCFKTATPTPTPTFFCQGGEVHPAGNTFDPCATPSPTPCAATTTPTVTPTTTPSPIPTNPGTPTRTPTAVPTNPGTPTPTPTAVPTNPGTPTPLPTNGDFGISATAHVLGLSSTPTGSGPTPTPTGLELTPTPTGFGPTPTPTVFELTPTPTGFATATLPPCATPTGTPQVISVGWGDTNCDGVINARDILFLLLGRVGGRHPTQCPAAGSDVKADDTDAKWGDYDCSGEADERDALERLKREAGLPKATPAPGCHDDDEVVEVRF